jgi:hypothetical protein
MVVARVERERCGGRPRPNKREGFLLIPVFSNHPYYRETNRLSASKLRKETPRIKD